LCPPTGKGSTLFEVQGERAKEDVANKKLLKNQKVKAKSQEPV
jgi:hypothetical protein